MAAQHHVGFVPLVFITLSIFFIQVQGGLWDVGKIIPPILNAEIVDTGKTKRYRPIYNDLTNNILNINSDDEKYEDYVQELKAQMTYFNKVYWNSYEDIDTFGVKLHPTTIKSMKLGNGPVYSLVYKTSGPVNNTMLHYDEYKSSYDYDQQTILKLTNNWDSLVITSVTKPKIHDFYTLTYEYKGENGETEEKGVIEKQNIYALIYYRYLQLNNKRHELLEFETEMKSRHAFLAIKDGGVKLCNANVPKVYCSRGFPFLGQINSKHRHFKAYHVAYLLETGGVYDEEDEEEEEQQQYHSQQQNKKNENEKGQEQGQVVPEEFLEELPFHRLRLITQPDQPTKIEDLDGDEKENKRKELTQQDHFYKYYEQVSQAQMNQQIELLNKRFNKEIPILVFKFKDNDPIYVEKSEEGAVIRKIYRHDPDYEFAAWSRKEVRATNEKLEELKAELEKGNVHIEAKVTDLSKTPIFMINHDPEEIHFQDPRYELIRYYHLKNLRQELNSR